MDEHKFNKFADMPMAKLLCNMSLPPILSMMIQSLYNIVDSVFVSNLSEQALTAVSLAFPIQNLVLSVAVGIGVGVNSYISRCLGASERERANQTASNGMMLALIASMFFMLCGALFARPYLSVFAKSDALLNDACDYAVVITSVSFAQIVNICAEKILQSTGIMLYPMVIQIIGAITNIVLDPLLIFGLCGFPSLGVKGAAIATVTGQTLSMCLSVMTLIFKEKQVRVRIRGFRPDLGIIRHIGAVAVPSGLMMSVGSLLVTGLNGILSAFSDTAVAFYGAYFKLQTFAYMPVSGLVQGLRPIIGYNYGAAMRKRIISAYKGALAASFCIMAVCSVLFVALPDEILSLFDASDAMLDIGRKAMPVMAAGFIFAAVSFVTSGLFEAVGRSLNSLILSLMRQLVLVLPLAFVFSYLFGVGGVWWAFPIAEAVSAAAAVFMLLRFNKKDSIMNGSSVKHGDGE